MGLWGLLTGDHDDDGGDKSGGVACSHWTAKEADDRFGRDRPRSGAIYCDSCRRPAR